MIIDGDDHNLDLLFYHRKLKRLEAKLHKALIDARERIERKKLMQ